MTSSSSMALAQAGAALLGGTLKGSKSLAGGCVSEVVQIGLADGREAVVKNGQFPRREADMLKAIAKSGAPSPKVLAVNDEVLVLVLLAAEDRGLGQSSSEWASLGRALATLHSATNDVPADEGGRRYGWAAYCAEMPLANAWSDDWPTFWAERRLKPHIGRLSPPQISDRLARLCADLPNRLPATPTPALLHGDLWTGNVLIHEGTVSGLIDPACYYGHAEVDLGMLTLFGRPPVEFYAAYGPLEDGFEQRRPVYQLWPALVHLRLFGGSEYRQMVESCLDELGF